MSCINILVVYIRAVDLESTLSPYCDQWRAAFSERMQTASAWLHRKYSCVLDMLPADLDAILALLVDENEDIVVIQVKDKWNSQWPERKWWGWWWWW